MLIYYYLFLLFLKNVSTLLYSSKTLLSNTPSTFLVIYHFLKEPEGQLLYQLCICRLVLMLVYYLDSEDEWSGQNFQYPLLMV